MGASAEQNAIDTAPQAASRRPVLLEGRNLSLGFGGVKALTDVSFTVSQGEVLSLIGPNGAGKTSLLNCISGRYRPQQGELIFNRRPITGMPTVWGYSEIVMNAVGPAANGVARSRTSEPISAASAGCEV
jgi:ABC-type branched-subunit amino acid transport system ATPase component